MSEILIVGGTPIPFPTSAEEPNWSEAILQFAEAVTEALSGVVGPNDVSPQVYTMVADLNTNVDLPSLQFPTSEVRAAIITYSVYRTTNSANAAEAGTIQTVYNPNNSSGLKWEFTQERVANGSITFAISDVGQISFSTTALGGTNHVGKISYSAKALSQS